MDSTANNLTREIDCSTLSMAELRADLIAATDEETIRLTGGTIELTPTFSGQCSEAVIRIAFSVGDFAGLLGNCSTIDIEGKAGNCCGHSFNAGSLVVRRTVGHYFAFAAQSGMLTCLGTAGDFAAANLSGADVFVRSTAGDCPGQGMQAGTLVLGNGCGEDLGQGMQGGVIYVRGDIGGVSKDVRAARMKDPDLMRLSLLLARAGIKSDGKDFKAYRAKRAKQ